MDRINLNPNNTPSEFRIVVMEEPLEEEKEWPCFWSEE